MGQAGGIASGRGCEIEGGRHASASTARRGLCKPKVTDHRI